MKMFNFTFLRSALRKSGVIRAGDQMMLPAGASCPYGDISDLSVASYRPNVTHYKQSLTRNFEQLRINQHFRVFLFARPAENDFRSWRCLMRVQCERPLIYHNGKRK
jgi:hypothetical protein